MNYFKTCDATNKIIDNHKISYDDLNLFKEFITKYNLTEFLIKSTNEISLNISLVIEKWFAFLQKNKNVPTIKKDAVYGNTIYRATFGESFTLEQLANNPLHYSPGSNGTGLYAVTNSQMGISYIKNHLTKRFSPFTNNIGNVLKIDISENAVVMSKMHLCVAKTRFNEEISQMPITPEEKTIYSNFINLDISIIAMLLGADIMFMPNGHVIVLNKNSLIFPESKEELNKRTLRVNLEKIRLKDKEEQNKINNFIQPEM